MVWVCWVFFLIIISKHVLTVASNDFHIFHKVSCEIALYGKLKYFYKHRKLNAFTFTWAEAEQKENKPVLKRKYMSR